MNSIEGIYESQGLTIASKHVEIIVRQMTSKAIIRESGDTPLLPGELVRISFLLEIDKAFQEAKNFQPPIYEPFLFSTTNSSLNKEGFLSAAGFQETKRILTKAALEGTSDWLRGLKECVILGRLVPAGSTFLNYKNYLDLVYLFKD
jgi:DNA-directed RNA polymerase subunit beta'